MELWARAESMIAALQGASVNSALDPDEGDFGSPDRLAVWQSRSLRFRLTHRWNVLRAFASGTVSFRSMFLGLRSAHCVVALAPKTSGAGMVYVCPAWISHLDELAVGPLTQQFDIKSSKGES